MKVKKTKINGYDVFIYKTKQYSTINMRFLFESDYDKKKIYMADLLANYMSCSMEKYKTRREINDRFMELYSPTWTIDNNIRGVKLLTKASFSFYDPVLVKDDYLEEAMEFASGVLLKPNFADGKLDESELNRCRDNLLNEIAEDLLDKQYKAYRSFVKNAYSGTYMDVDLFDDKEEAVELINGFSHEDLIECHDEIFKHSCVGLIIMGNVKEEHLSYIEQHFKFAKTKPLDIEFEDELTLRDDVEPYIKETDVDYNESILRCVYTCSSKSYKEQMTYSMISKMLSSSGMLLHKVLRDEMKLVYRVSSGYSKYTNTIVLKAFLDKKNEKKALDGFDKVLSMLRDENLVEAELAKIKEKNDLALYTYDENKWNPFSDLYLDSFKLNYKLEKKYKTMESVTKEDIFKALDKMEKRMVHFYEGGKE